MKKNFLKQSNMKYKHKRTGIIFENDLRLPNERYPYVSEDTKYTLPSWVIEDSNDWEKIEEEPKYKLFSANIAHRLSDGMQFNLRETVRAFAGAYDEEEVIGQILSFEWIGSAQGLILAAQVGKYKIDLNRLEKPVLITGDGIPVFDPNQVVYAVNSQWGVSNLYAKDAQKFLPENMKRIFSTKEARLEYMVMNKPILTLAEIEEPSAIMRSKWIEIKIKVKEKLKQNDSNL